MSDSRPDPSWWLASDGKWMPESHPSHRTPAPTEDEDAAPGPTVEGAAGAGPARMAEANRKGEAGEQATGDALMGLPSSYRVAHSLRMGKRRKDIDHVVVGPAGVWVIDSKHWSGELTAGKGTLLAGADPDPQGDRQRRGAGGLRKPGARVVESVDASGQSLDSYDIEVVTPAAPC